MARTVNPARHAERRLAIIDAALTRFAADGYDGTSTAAICREAGIASGTLFHYFPTKADVLLGILEVGTAETRAWFEARRGRPDPRAVLGEWIDRTVADFADRRLAGFVRAVSAMLTRPGIAEALAAEEAVTREGLTHWVAAAQRAGQVRTDLDAGRLATWLALLVDGFVGQVAYGADFDPAAEGGLLREVAGRLLSP